MTLKNTEIKEYMRKIFTRKYDDRPRNIGYTFLGVQGIDSSYAPGLTLPTARERANSINKNISNWLGGVWGLDANVVAVDFFCSSNLIDIAVYVNGHKDFGINEFVNFDIHT